MHNYIGYPGMNRTLRDRQIRANRTIQKKTFESSDGIEKVGNLFRKNLIGLIKILDWNIKNDIYLYRCSSNVFPWMNKVEFEDLHNEEEITDILNDIGSFITKNNIRLSFHPDHYCKLGSTTEEIRQNSRKTISQHGEILDRMGVEQSSYYPINIHIGAHYGDKEKTMQRFIESVNKIPDKGRKRIVVENDDKKSLFSAEDLYSEPDLDIPITFDYHHHMLNGNQPYQDVFDSIVESWDNVRPISHYSEAKRLHKYNDVTPKKHSEYISMIPQWLYEKSDVMIESRGKEKSILRVRD